MTPASAFGVVAMRNAELISNKTKAFEADVVFEILQHFGIRKTAGKNPAVNMYQSSLRTAMNASCGTSTVPTWRILRFPFFCFSSSLRLREISPP